MSCKCPTLYGLHVVLHTLRERLVKDIQKNYKELFWNFNISEGISPSKYSQHLLWPSSKRDAAEEVYYIQWCQGERVWTSISDESPVGGGNRANQRERKPLPSMLVSTPGHSALTAIRSVKDTSAKSWYSKHKADREFSPALFCSVVRFIFSLPLFFFFLLLRVSVIFIHFNSRCEIVGCHLPFCSAAGQNYKWVDINGSPEFSAVLVDGIENVLIWQMKCLPLKLQLDFSWLHLAGIFFFNALLLVFSF